MPRLDRTGPKGEGSQSGRGLGKCSPREEKKENKQDAEENFKGRGLVRGRGKGRGQGLGRGRL